MTSTCPKRFVLAQLRGASYYTEARNVRPEEAGGSDSYTGPVWDLVRVGEPKRGAQAKPQSPWRLYYINTSTGLIDKIVSEEQGETITAEISGWTNQNGELAPGLGCRAPPARPVRANFPLPGFRPIARRQRRSKKKRSARR